MNVLETIIAIFLVAGIICAAISDPALSFKYGKLIVKSEYNVAKFVGTFVVNFIKSFQSNHNNIITSANQNITYMNITQPNVSR